MAADADHKGRLEAVLETDRLLLEPLRREHARHLFQALSDPR